MKYLRSERALWALLLALFALNMQILVPLAQAIRTSDGKDGYSGRMIICTLYGAQVIDVALGDKDDPGKSEIVQSCPICLAYSIGVASLATSVEITVSAPVAVSLSVAPLRELTRVSQSDFRKQHARGPPLAA